MGKTLTEVAQQLKDANKKVQLIYAFNGTGKTRLSRAFKIINFTSHSTLSNEAVAQPTPAEKATVKLLLDHLKNSHGFCQQQGT